MSESGTSVGELVERAVCEWTRSGRLEDVTN
jgi:hypothetical protein